ncbi:MAG: hypothetical protein K0Q47_141 [Sedimentibacter sp.]|jgi:hypothetical protein|nr:hypothetical protein [Sedimentibacter sp.]
MEFNRDEYCKAKKCGVMICMEDDEIKEEWKTFEVVKNSCLKCEAFKFHKWLLENDYRIVKE